MRQRVSIEKQVAKSVRSQRERQQLSQADLARLAGTSRSQVAAVEQGDRSPTVTTLEKFARALRVPMSDLLGDTDVGVGAVEESEQLGAIVSKLRGRDPDFLTAVEHFVAVLDRAVRGAAKAGKS